MNRNRVMQGMVLLVMAVIVARLFCIQILEYDEWVAKAAAQQTMQYTLTARRGEIYMMDDGEPSPVVMNATVYTVIVDPMLADEDELKQELDGLMGEQRVAEWGDVFADKTRRYYIVGKNIERKVAEQITEKISEKGLTGVWLSSDTKRVYPEGSLASTVLGFVNADGVGQYGVEGALNEQLTGKDGLLRATKDVSGVALSIGDDNIRVPAEDGTNVVLTIDKGLQYKVEKILAEQSKSLGFANLSAIVMDPNSGKILAMADYPGYDPANYGNVDSAARYVNHVLEDPYEPASVCKTFAFATAIDNGVMTPESTYNNTGSITIDGWPIDNAEKGADLLGPTSMQKALNYSLNTGSMTSLMWLGGSDSEINGRGREILYQYYHDRFGLGTITGVELYESLGLVTEPAENSMGINSTYANMTFGQNMLVTMVQVTAAFSSVVNGGNYYTPTVVAGEMKDGEFIAKEEPKADHKTISEATSATMREMLWGTRNSARTRGIDPEGYYIGGKTGTAQVIKDGAYSFDETHGTYIGYGGATGELPSYVIMVRVWEEGKLAAGQTHGYVVFNALKGAVQEFLKVKPGNVGGGE